MFQHIATRLSKPPLEFFLSCFRQAPPTGSGEFMRWHSRLGSSRTICCSGILMTTISIIMALSAQGHWSVRWICCIGFDNAKCWWFGIEWTGKYELNRHFIIILTCLPTKIHYTSSLKYDQVIVKWLSHVSCRTVIFIWKFIEGITIKMVLFSVCPKFAHALACSSSRNSWM